MNNTRKSKARFKVGDWVSFPFGRDKVLAQIIEDRGPIGAKGQRLYRIEIQLKYTEPDRFEAREEDLTLAVPPHKKVNIS